jgi:Protein of unknown function (DUF3703)
MQLTPSPTSFAKLIHPHVEAELRAAIDAEHQGDAAMAFSRLERAHVLGQASTVEHVRVHWRMFVWGWQHRSAKECAGQLLRIVGAATKTAFGLVPSGNTGGSNISPFKRLPIPSYLAATISQATTAKTSCNER